MYIVMWAINKNIYLLTTYKEKHTGVLYRNYMYLTFYHYTTTVYTYTVPPMDGI